MHLSALSLHRKRERSVFAIQTSASDLFSSWQNNPDVRQHGWTELGHIAAAKWDDAKKAVLALNLKKPKVYDGTWCRRHARHALRAMDKKGLKRKPGQGREYGVNNKLMTG